MKDDIILCPVSPDESPNAVDEEANGGERAGSDDIQFRPCGEEVPRAEEGMVNPAEEARASRPARDPGAPTAAMREAHAATHLPFRIWCEECVAGRKDNPAHVAKKEDENALPEVALDYCLLRRENESETLTILVLKDRRSRAVRAWVMPNKGAERTDGVERALQGIKDFGHRGPILVKVDNEPATLALREALMERLPEGAAPVETPVRESQSNGSVENGVKLFKGLARVHLAALEKKIEGHLPSAHPVMAWLVECVADILTKYMQGNDGKTGYERLFGKEIREEGLEFGEQIWWRKPRKQETNVILDPRWSAGSWLARKWGTILHLVAVGDKVLEVRAVIRRPKVERWERTTLEAIRATPWQNPAASISENIPGHDLPPRTPTEAPVDEPTRAERAYAPHRMKIENSDLNIYGYTSNCKRCLRLREGRRAQGMLHHEECRTRIEAAMRAAGDRRIRDADQRINEEIARLAEQLVPRAEEERGAAGSIAPAESVPAAQAPLAEDPPEQEQVHVNEDDMVDSLFRRMPRRVGEEATRIYELLLTDGCDPCDAKTKVCELYSPPRVTKELGKLPIMSLVAGSCFVLRMDADGRS